MLHIAASAMTPADISWDFIIGGLALFLFGIQFMGDGLKSIAGEKLREYIDQMCIRDSPTAHPNQSGNGNYTRYRRYPLNRKPAPLLYDHESADDRC